jgi:hypothetical protein
MLSVAFFVILSVIMPNIIMPNIILPNDIMLSVCRGALIYNFKQKTVSITELNLNSECCYVKCHFFVILSVIMLNVVMLSVVALLIATLSKRQSG